MTKCDAGEYGILECSIIFLLATKAKKYYSTPARQYHNWNHAQKVRALISGYFSQELTLQELSTLDLAAAWHDAIYIPKSLPSINEVSSAYVLSYEFERQLKKHPFTAKHSGNPVFKEVVETATKLITRTTIKDHLIAKEITDNNLLAILLDCDIAAGMVSGYDIFCNTQKDIINENLGDDKLDLKACSEFLNKFITARQYIFHTNIARRLWENEVRINITKFSKDHY